MGTILCCLAVWTNEVTQMREAETRDWSESRWCSRPRSSCCRSKALALPTTGFCGSRESPFYCDWPKLSFGHLDWKGPKLSTRTLNWRPKWLWEEPCFPLLLVLSSVFHHPTLLFSFWNAGETAFLLNGKSFKLEGLGFASWPCDFEKAVITCFLTCKIDTTIHMKLHCKI